LEIMYGFSLFWVF